MLSLPGYHISKLIFQDERTRIYRGVRTADQQPVILKLYADDYPDQQHLNRLRHEYQIGHSLDDPHLLHYLALESHQHALVLVEEDAGMVSLADWLPLDGLTPTEFLPIALQLTEALEVLHEHHIIHKDICPRNILIHPETHQVKLTDFSVASQLSRETCQPAAPRLLEGTLTHISPEQTGRMNRTVDYRTDFYALGVTFYQLLTGQLPFDVKDELELIHCHLSKSPVPPRTIKPAVAPLLSDLVLKLMAKNAEDRYQSAQGLKVDLERCLHDLEIRGKLIRFPLGQHDFAATLQPSQRLYGRYTELKQLLAAFERVARGGCELLMVAGYSGIGKTSLVQQVHKPIVAKRGWFCSGKFDQFQRSTPYFAWLRALENLLKQILTEPDSKLKEWESQLADALYPNAQVSIEVLPILELILGPQPPVPSLAPSEAEHRFHQTLQQLIDVFAHPEHPLVLFLDDLQWADGASLQLLEEMVTVPERHYLLCIGAYRDNEVKAGHPLLNTLERIQASETAVHTLTLQPLSLDDMNQLLADTLQAPPEQVASLSDLVIRKTAGNPFFTNEFLKTLEHEQLLRFDLNQRAWTWDVTEIEQTNITDNVVELLETKIGKLPEASQHILQLAACIDTRFDLKTLSLIHKVPMAQICLELWPAVQAGLIQPLEDMNPIVQLPDGDYQVPDETPILNTLYKFTHDRVQQAAYEEIPTVQRPVMHLEIGRLLLRHIDPDELDKQLFTLTEHLNAGRDLIETEEERLKLARLNLQAGEKAKQASAYSAAARYFAQGRELLPETAWDNVYDLWFSLMLQEAETNYLSGHFNTAEQQYLGIQAHTSPLLDKIRVFEVQMNQYQLQGRYQEALAIQREGLALLGSPLQESREAVQTEIDQELETIQNLLSNRQIESLIDAPVMEDPQCIAVMQLLHGVFYSAYLLGNTHLVDLARIRMTRLSLQYGNAELSPLGYVLYGAYLCWTHSKYETGYQFGQLALKLAEHHDKPSITGRTHSLFAAFVSPWTHALKTSISHFENAIKTSDTTGDWVTLGYACVGMMRYRFYRGENLSSLYQDIQHYHSQLLRTRNTEMADNLVLLFHAIRQLQGIPDDVNKSDTPLVDEQAFLHKYADVPPQIALLYHTKIQFTYLLGQQAHWPDFIAKQDWLETALPELWDIIDISFYIALICLAEYPTATTTEQESYRERIQSIQTRMKRWADHNPANNLHKYCLIQAESIRVLKGVQLEAMDRYEQAITSAKEHEFVHIEALANELYAGFWLQQSREEIASLYLRKAHSLYRQWGAQAKLDMLESRYPWLILKQEATERVPVLVTASQDASLDWLSLLKAAQLIAGKATSSELTPTLMKLMVENIGAERGCLILVQNSKLQIEALYPKPDTSITLPLPVEKSRQVSQAAIRYVARTQQPLVLNHINGNRLLGRDPYIKTHKPRSLLCMPLVEQQELMGLVYLEHRSLPAVFTHKRMELLKVLSAQAAIALKNARLYEELNNSQSRYRDLVEGSIQGILIHRDCKPLFANQALAHMLGFRSARDLETLDSIKPLLAPASQLQLEQYRERWRRDDITPEPYELEVHRQDGATRTLRIMDRRVQWNGVTALQSTLMDVTDRKKAEQQLQYLASHDMVTGLPNRTLFHVRLQQAATEAQQEHSQVAVMLLDLDHFKAVNDSLGQTVGDALLKAVAERLQQLIHTQGAVASRGGDEFAVLLPHLNQANEADQMARRLLHTLAEPFSLSDIPGEEQLATQQTINITGSLGISLYPSDSEDPEQLLRDADLALQRAKSQGRNTHSFFQESMNLQLLLHQSLVDPLRQALTRDELTLYYQPRVDLAKEQVVGLEATVRWPRSGGPTVSPAQFLPIAEQAGLGPALGEWVLHRACQQLRQWQQEPLKTFPITLSLPASLLQQPDLFSRVQQLLQETEVPPYQLELSLGEELMLQETEIAIDNIARLAGLGLRFILSEFGIKHSSVNALKRFHLNGIKLDRSFLFDLDQPDTWALVDGLVNLAHNLKLTVIGDGVDNEAQLEFLREMGCDQAQGRYYSPPLTARSFEQWYGNYVQGGTLR